LRVHQLAKELGLPTKDLLKKITQDWGLENKDGKVKNSPSAGVDTEIADKIRRLIKGSAALETQPSEPHAEPDAPQPPSPSESPSPTPPSETPAIRPSEAKDVKRPGGPSPVTEPRSAPGTPAPEEASPSGPSAPGFSAPPQGPPPSRPDAPTSRPAGPLAGHGPLSGHTRGSGSGPARSGGSGTGSSGGPPPSGSGSEPRPKPAPVPPPAMKRPIERGDYIGPAGTRPTSSGGRSSSAPSGRRDGGAGGGSGSRPSGRPLPPVAAGGGAPAKKPEPRPGGPGPSGPPKGGSKSGGPAQQPERRFTKDELLEMMRKGQLADTPPTPGSAKKGGKSGTAEPPAAPPTERPPTGAPAGPARRAGSFPDEEEKRSKSGRIGSAADRNRRRAKRQERAKDRITSPVSASALIEGEEESRRGGRGPRRSQRHQRGAMIAPRKTEAVIEPPITLRDLSEAIGIKANELMRTMMRLYNQLSRINDFVDGETATELAIEHGVELTIAHPETAEDAFRKLFESAGHDEAPPDQLQPRPPVVTILGHVDHGKTSLLDRIRKANVVSTEAGGITQHIGAYQVEHNGHKVTFVDTPGHEAFTAMRARGANVTDIAVIVIAADDGVMPQTKEAIAHAKAAAVQIVVALNKFDLHGAEGNVTRIYNELSQEELIPEDYGGDVPVVKTSATSGMGVEDLLETLATIAELYEYKANPSRPATGTCLESQLSEGEGVVATVLVQDGTLRVGDIIACGEAYGRVRALKNHQGQLVQEAGPSTPVEVSGLDLVPVAGEKFAALEDVAQAREVAESRRDRSRGASLKEAPAVTLESLYDRMAEKKVKSLNLILKADVQGSIEALTKEIEKLENDEVPIRVLLKGVGGINESDVMLADASEAIVIGFRVAPEERAVTLAEEKKIEIRRYDVIYQVSDEIKKAIEGRLEPEIKEVHLGRAVVRQVFRISGIGSVAGCFVTQGTIERNAQARIIRDGREIYKGTIEALKRFKDDVREVRENYECGVKVAKYDDVKVDDVIEAYRVEVIRRSL